MRGREADVAEGQGMLDLDMRSQRNSHTTDVHMSLVQISTTRPTQLVSSLPKGIIRCHVGSMRSMRSMRGAVQPQADLSGDLQTPPECQRMYDIHTYIHAIHSNISLKSDRRA